MSGPTARSMGSASILSKLFWTWVSPLITLGTQKTLVHSDLPPLDTADTTAVLSDKLASSWEAVADSGSSLRFPRALWSAFGRYYALISLFVVGESAVRILQVVALAGLVEYVGSDQGQDSPWNASGWLWCLFLVSTVFVHGLTHHGYFFGANRVGFWTRVSLASLMYRKALRVPASALGGTSVGKVVSIVSADSQRLELFATYCVFLILAPLEVLAALILMWLAIGPACLVGFATLCLILPLQHVFSKRIGARRSLTSSFTDSRLKFLNDVLKGMRVVKLNDWGASYEALINDSRADEVQSHRVMGRYTAVNLSSFSVFPILAALTTFATVYFTEQSLTPARVFVVLALFNAIALTFTLFVPLAIMFGAEALVVVKRVEAFLDIPEFTPPALSSSSSSSSSSKAPYISLNPRDGHSFVWEANTESNESESGRFMLSSLSFSILPGQLLAVIGPVGAGKSSLLSALVGEMMPGPGSPPLPEWTGAPSLAYVGQEAFILSATIRDNILFGREYSESRYKDAIEASALHADLDLWPLGEFTFIGERGVNLSGGQKARVSLARAMYAQPDVYLLDDPLSAVDARVGAHIFQHGITGLMRRKRPGAARAPAVVLVTHRLHYALHADCVALMIDGKIPITGTMEHIMSSKYGVQVELLAKHVETADTGAGAAAASPSPASPSPHPMVNEDVEEGGKDGGRREVAGDDAKQGAQVAEESSTGSVTLATYRDYLRSMGSVGETIGVFFLCFLGEAAVIMPNWWLSQWASASDEEQRDETWLYVYAAMAGVAILLGLARAQVFFGYALNAAASLHRSMLGSVIRAPMKFFDDHPSGRVLNRFSEDQATLDAQLPWTMYDFVQVSLRSLTVLVVTSIVVPWILIPILPLTWYFVRIRKQYVASSRELKRLDAVSRSPVLAQFASSMSGLTTIRAYGVQSVFADQFTHKLDENTRAYMMFLASSRWLGLRLDMMSSVFVTLFSALAVLTASSISPGLLALALMYSLLLTGAFQWAVRQSSVVENLMTSVERQLNYCALPQEPGRETAPEVKAKLPPGWPRSGAIDFCGLTLRYASDQPPVLRDVSATIPSGARVGIVGRSGAGKSSLLAALFRLTEPDSPGSILLDGVATSDLGLGDLRSALAVVPQDPVLFAGTLRANLDPFDHASDADIWDALDLVSMRSAVNRMSESSDVVGSGLEVAVSESGSNFSVGQRQLLCLARALLRPAPVLVIDEASAHLDMESDRVLQAAIRNIMSDRTVLSVAHRLHTVIDFDSIMVVDAGELVEYGSPAELLADPDSVFSSLVDATGRREGAKLRAAALAGTAYVASAPNSARNSDVDVGDGRTDSYAYEYEYQYAVLEGGGSGGSDEYDATTSLLTSEL